MLQPSFTEKQLWISSPKPVSHPRLRLICIPYAGSGPVVFSQWPQALPPDVEVWGVRLPGRETRLREPAFDRLSPLVAALAEGLEPHMDVPFAIFGHSMGALIGFEMVHYWRDHSGPQPVHLLVSGHRAPHRPPLNPPVHQADKQTFLNRLKALGGTPARFFEMDDLVELLLPTLRADFAVWETYQYEEKPPLPIPLTVMGGRTDSEATESDYAAWRQHTTGEFTLHLFNGGHFYFSEDLSSLTRLVGTVLIEDC
ncbi:MAG: thioesterase [Ardenticatenaceae bacterium]|nr:thioesterase [Ardenticatenaceae bacterium]MCB8987090.1 thioesterase [Ardenticatenaceae bacterium]